MVEITNREVKTKKKSKNKQLNANAICAFRFLKDTKTYLDRIQTLEKCGEYCYAILNIWNRIEATLKLLRYFDDIKEYPPKLNSQWAFLKDIKTNNEDALKVIFSSDKQCLWKIRNGIVHQNKTLTKNKYEHYYSPADIILKELTKILPSQKDFQEKLNRTRK